jgi:hypothetical protein
MTKSGELKKLIDSNKTENNDYGLEEEIRDLDLAVDLFAIAMKQKLSRKAREGYRGLWNDIRNYDNIQKMLEEHLERLKRGELYQEVDISNLSMMLFHLNYSKAIRGTWEKRNAR